MKKSILLFYILSSMVISEECHTESDWCFNQAINFAFYIFEEANINGIELARGVLETDGSVSCPSGDCDVIGAFNGDVCVGWSTYYINEGLDDKFTLAVNGYDGNNYSAGYLLNGQIPNFKFFDSSTGIILNAESNIEIPMFQNFGGFIMGELNAESESINQNLLTSNFEFNQIYPNPFNPSTTISYKVHKFSNIKIDVVNLKGQNIQSIFNGYVNQGLHNLNWHPKNLNSGTYLIRISYNNNIQQNQKVVFLK
tara:strand:+ start:645 stop:1406 length:762 start_codon:yes stop_codon:yes gene_type:complete